MASLRELMTENIKVSKIVSDGSLSNAAVVDYLEALLGKRFALETVRILRKSIGVQRNSVVPASDDAPQPGTGKATTTAEGGEFVNVVLDAPVMDGNFTHVFKLFNLDPTIYCIVEDTVRCSTWQQSKRLDNGNRDTVQLYSYSCRFQKISAALVSENDIEERRERVLSWTPSIPFYNTASIREPCTFVINWADWQLGKSEGGGVKATEERVLDSFQRCTDRIAELRKIGRNIEGIAIVNMGDPVEGCMGNYASQLSTVELTQRQQLLLAMDLFETGIRTLTPLADKADVIGVLCNHGEWNRVDGKSVTSDSDNASGFILDAVQRVLKDHKSLQHVKWTIPHDEIAVMAELSGVWNAFTHGHKMKSGTLTAEESWLSNHSIHLLREYGVEPRLWTTAHKHHAFLIDLGPWHRIQCSALDGGSKWYTDATGKWSAPGTTTYLAGKHDVRGFSDYAIL